ncbi:endonuclease domain-containing protein [Fischerella sp. PCC 9605]|uniref:endonuclease domain-containing protein n=1 Tax=Fischerella sp. PCC 9605 TaxID=1173024 RepID=UPI0018CC3412|nr:endonuclease domain-containing protein [Fischerella sp. PCC 9605]
MELEKRSLSSPPSPLSQVGRGGTRVGREETTNSEETSPTPLSQDGRGAGGEGIPDKWQVSPELRKKMIEVARQFRKEPTLSEAILWQTLRNRKLEGRKFRRQQPIGNFIVDFFCAAERLIVEVDGEIHESQKILDQQRQELLESLGLRFVRINSHLVENNLSVALDTIRQALTANSPHPPAPSPKFGEGE